MSGGTYSVFRVAYGVWLGALLVGAALDAQAGSEGSVAATAAWFGAIACLPFAAGLRDRAAALVIAPAVLIVGGPAGLILSFLTIAPLVVHVALPRAPYGSLDAYGRPDPAGGFAFSEGLSFALRAVLAGAYGAVAVRAFEEPAGGNVTGSVAEFFPAVFAAAAGAFFVLGLSRRYRAAGWAVMVVALVARLVLVDDALGGPLLFAHLLAFEPALVPPLRIEGGERVFYDGNCGLCHRAVRFMLAEDPSGEAFRFAPIHGDAFERELDDDAARALPDSIVVVTREGRVLVRSRAIFRMMEGLGGFWRGLAVLMRLIPRPIADAAYDGVAVVRHRVFPRPADVCPIVPKRLRSHFDA
ncbi:MAG: DUF393 domain-containing protein [Deltaproteobacteria bacterium]|nr:DUF393 domain-containing protein [Deltaproteobacteria bacterium]